ncbi:Aldo/keto reductase [Hortaea werneckii]|uniref:NADP-dependent oxidoreductase domain-containing protein n=1 Tax=Hortaea werneckii TaxID=91943 RepID=A0A3M7BTY8_HORWE|nr:Aldo/keto reductase [Hortaea werneckii]KAI7626362.1 Aldo/keto reductase [Hortaea werneckii]KAI7636299.1 Aldo/keto reductase [Hortaea werneckii]KAI7681689.1 Aldo/keto reductase [Hortaea werneckii]KAI7682018.1 Aldo/keto reductase [Hortaea werneckii]
MAGAFSLATHVTLNNGLTMPQIQLGVYLMSSSEASQAVKYALDAGYRAIDSAQMYHNEREVGHAILDYLNTHPELKREDIHYTTKLASNGTYDRARASIKKSVKECGLGYIDLFLLHSPYGGKQARLESWRAVEDAIRDGEVRSGGVSNFGEKHITELLTSTPRIKPAVNQIELHPFNPHPALTALCTSHSIRLEAYAPLARALRMTHPTIVALSKKYACTPAQLLVRWSCQMGFVPLPKSVRRERIEENAMVSGFEIAEEDMRELGGLDEGLVTDWDPLDAD